MLGRSAVEQLSSLSSRTKWQRLPAGSAAILFYWIRMKVVQQLTCLVSNTGRPNGPAYLFDR